MTKLIKGFVSASNHAGEQRAWVRPTVQRLSAGNAENGGDVSTDISSGLS